MATPWLNDSGHFLFWLQKLINAPRQRSVPSATPIKHKIPYSEPKIFVNPSSILQPILAKSTPTCSIFADKVSRGSKRKFFAFFPLFGESR